MVKIAVIGGTGLETLHGEFDIERHSIETCFGSVPISLAKHKNFEFHFLSRHGENHDVAPHDIPYQANIAALVEIGVTHVLATNAVGSLRPDLPPGSFVLYDDFLDFTRQRQLSFWDGHPTQTGGVIHTDFTVPYCRGIRRHLISTAVDIDVAVIERGTYVCADGPRFESPAEIRMFSTLGGDVVGMTGLPEAIFAREAGIHYAGIGIVSNFGAGLTTSTVDHDENSREMLKHAETIQSVLLKAIETFPNRAHCSCFSV